MLEALEEALKLTNISLLKAVRDECDRRAGRAANEGFREFWLKKSTQFDRRVTEVARAAKQRI
jgi:hypothetical protein